MIALVLKVPGHLMDAVERIFQELLVDQWHQVRVHRHLTLQLVVERPARHRDRAALRPDR